MAGASKGTPSWVSALGNQTGLAGVWGTGQTPVANELLVAIAIATNANSSAPAIAQNAGNSGWSLRTSKAVSISTGRLQLNHYDKVAAGSDATPAFDFTNTSGGVDEVVLLDLTGLDPAGTIDITFTPGSASGANPTVATSAGTVANNTFQVAVVQLRGSGALTITWTAPLTSLGVPFSANSTNNADIATSNTTVGGSQIPTATGVATGSQDGILAISYKLAVTVDSGTAAMAATASLGLTPAQTELGTAAMAATASLGLTPAQTEPATSAMAAAASLGATGVDTIPSTAAMAATASLGVTGGTGAVAAMQSAASLGLTPAQTEPGTAAMAATASLGATGVDAISSTAAMQSAASLGLTPAQTEPGTAAMAATASLGLTAGENEPIQAHASLGVAGADMLTAMAAMQAIASLTAAGQVAGPSRDIVLIPGPAFSNWQAGPATRGAHMPGPAFSNWQAGPATKT